MADSTSVGQIKDTLKLCLTQRQGSFHNVTAFSMRFEDDDTGASRAFNNFKDLASIFGISNVEEYIISANDKMPGWTVTGRLVAHLSAAIRNCSPDSPERCLVLIHYASHGFSDDMTGPSFKAAPNTKAFSDSSTSQTLYRTCLLLRLYRLMLPAFLTAVVLDLHTFSHHLLPALLKFWRRLPKWFDTKTASNTSECFTTRRTLMAKFADAAAIVRGQARSVDFAELLDRSHQLSSAKFPVHRFLNGSVSVRLFFPKQSTAFDPVRLSPALEQGKYKIIFSCYVTDNHDSEEMANLLKRVESLSPAIGITVDSIYEYGSSGLVFSDPYTVYKTLSTSVHVDILFGGLQFAFHCH
ncbi:hypothetical protein H109_04046 [Trichophyton interdigitale MR816]|uniref:Uncharacterized protein n=1 Tax=Trichophyton interdigitale (strain MR816) TaxID=1215338 RepID=A0A059J8A2_TRIIM|nr:hypothetical protein H101_00142 [Trichophyton interdigitale H6]KDB24101.1 hypothetical protein H109_04046 [Trichophyton interdigitale MR816]